MAQRSAERETRRLQAQRAARRAQRRPRILVFGLSALVLATGLGLGLGLGLSSAPRVPQKLVVHKVRSSEAVSSVAQGLGAGWLTDDRRDVIERFDPTTGTVEGKSLSVKGRPVFVTTAFGHLWVASMLTDTVEEIAPAPLRLVRTIAVPQGPASLVAFANRLWVASVIAGKLTSIDPTSGRVLSSVLLKDGADRMAAGGAALYVTGTTDTVTSVHLVNGRVVTKSTNVDQGSLGVAVGGGKVFVAAALAAEVDALDPVTLRVEMRYRAGPDPVGVAYSDGRLFVTDGSSDDLRTVGPGATGAVALNGVPREVLPSDTGVWVAVANPGAVASATVG